MLQLSRLVFLGICRRFELLSGLNEQAERRIGVADGDRGAEDVHGTRDLTRIWRPGGRAGQER